MNESIDQLCPNCGLCCDSTLFADVELQKGDDTKRLFQLGLTLSPKSRGKISFAQSCACFDGKLCKIYADRPKRCRTFECGLLKKVAAEDLSAVAALKKISEAKKLSVRVRGLLEQLGNRDEQRALTHRYAQAMSGPVDFADKTSAARQGELMLAVHELMEVLQRDFLR